MLQILRALKPEIMQIRRLCGSQRYLSSHYETLRIPPDASQREIRIAFLKLSKEMHPDISKKTNHAGFVKVNEAYKVLSKRTTRREYDMELKFNQSSDGRPVRVIYYEHEPTYRRAPVTHNPNEIEPYYYGIRGLKRVSNITIAFLCLILSAFGLSLTFLLVNKSVVVRRDLLLTESEKWQEEYKKIRTKASVHDHEHQIAAIEQRLNNKSNEISPKVQS